jgi:ribosome-associated protein
MTISRTRRDFSFGAALRLASRASRGQSHKIKCKSFRAESTKICSLRLGGSSHLSMGPNCLNPAKSPGFFFAKSRPKPRRESARRKTGRSFLTDAVAIRSKSLHVVLAVKPAITRTATLTTSAFSQNSQAPASSSAAGVLSADRLADKILSSLEEAKAEEVVSIDLAGKTALADTMIIATGRSTVHVGAIADRVIKACKAAGVSAPRVEGLPQCDWVLVDAGDVIVHIFRPEVRQFYNLEKMWGGDRPREMRLA